jgi:hypothetical protein
MKNLFESIINTYKLGKSVQNFKPGTGLTKNLYGEWVTTVYKRGGWLVCVGKTGETLFKDPTQAIKAIK